jgi:hypothetical protein
MTLQEIFDKSVGGVIAQGQQSLNRDKSSCMYRGEDGAKCVVGHLITDENYYSSYEGGDISSSRVRAAVEGSIGELSTDAFNLLKDLQEIHDDGPEHGFIEEFIKGAIKVAESHGLNHNIVIQQPKEVNMKTVKLTNSTNGEIIDKRTVKVVTNQSVSGSGSRNIIVWALKASKLGYMTLEVHAPMAEGGARNSVATSVRDSNDLLNHLGVKVVLL